MTGMPFRFVLAICASLAATASTAQDAPQETSPALSVELNAATSSQGGCTLSFLISNGYPAPIDQAVFETVLFDAEGRVERLTLFDFGALPPGRPRVRQFTLPDTSCEAIGRILVNGVGTCEADGLEPDACMDGLQLSTRTDIEVIG